MPFGYAPIPSIVSFLLRSHNHSMRKPKVTIIYINNYFPFFDHFPETENVAFIILYAQPPRGKYDQVNYISLKETA